MAVAHHYELAECFGSEMAQVPGDDLMALSYGDSHPQAELLIWLPWDDSLHDGLDP
jgi:hypothetical protein